MNTSEKRLGLLVVWPLMGAIRWLAGVVLALVQLTSPVYAQSEVDLLDYKLGGGDTLRITVHQNPDLTIEARLSELGMISYPLLGQLKVGGLAVSDVESMIASGLKERNFVKQPVVTATLLQVRGHQASVLGHVTRPGRFPLESPTLRVSDLLALAGGTMPTAADILVLTGVRDGKPFRVEIELPKLFGPSGTAQNLVIRNGDTLFVDRAPMVYIYGEVQRPGSFRIERNMTVMQVLAAGGGLNLRGTERGIELRRRLDAEGRVVVSKPKMDDPVRDGDVIFVQESLF